MREIVTGKRRFGDESGGAVHVFRRLSVFPAASTLQAAEHVCKGDGIDEQDVLDLLSRLVSQSLAVVDSSAPPTLTNSVSRRNLARPI